jgi:hypothetical protein
VVNEGMERIIWPKKHSTLGFLMKWLVVFSLGVLFGALVFLSGCTGGRSGSECGEAAGSSFGCTVGCGAGGKAGCAGGICNAAGRAEDCQAGRLAAKRGKLVGVAGVSPEANFADISALGALAIQLAVPVGPLVLRAALDRARPLGMSIGARGAGASRIQKSGQKPDSGKIKAYTSAVFSTNSISADPYFLYYYLLDEPCNPAKWNITRRELEQAYQAVKSVDQNILVFINFGHLDCLASYLSTGCPGGRITDIAAFTITPWKLRKSPGLISEEDVRASAAKQCDPSLKVVPLVSVYEFPAGKWPLPPASWVREQGMEILRHDNFDGIMYYPWGPTKYAGSTIEDVVNDPAYASAFNDVFAAAREKFG